MSLDNTSQPSVKYCADRVNAKYIHGRPEPELVPSRYALKVGEIDVMVVSDGVLSLPGAMLGHNADPAVRAAWLEDMFLPPDARRTTLCPGVWPPVRWTTTPGATSYSVSNVRIWPWYSFKNRLAVRRSASGNPGGMETREKSGDSQNLVSAAAT